MSIPEKVRTELIAHVAADSITTVAEFTESLAAKPKNTPEQVSQSTIEISQQPTPKEEVIMQQTEPKQIEFVGSTVETPITEETFDIDDLAITIHQELISSEEAGLIEDIIIESDLTEETFDTETEAILHNPEIVSIDETVFVEDIGMETDLIEENFEDEIGETFEQLVALLETSHEQDGINETAGLELETDDFATSPTNVFEEFIATHPQPEVPPDIESIQEVANERTLEETLVSLAMLLEETPKENEDVKDITELLNELVEAFDQPIDTVGPETKLVRITPEITYKLLTLLRLIGCENPRQVLLEFISRHDLEFLIQAIRYLAQLTNQDNQQELLHPKLQNPFISNIFNIQTLKVGKLVLGFARRNFAFAE